MNSVHQGKKYLITSGLPYSNGRPHVGHVAGAYLTADIYVRYLRLCGAEVAFICGSDDHGVSIMLTAEKEGKTPAEVSAYYGGKQKEGFASVGINFDVFGSTSRNPFHKPLSQHFFMSLYKLGLFEKQRSRQFYDESRSMFLPDRFVKGTCSFCQTAEQYGDQCENCGKLLDVDSLKDAKSVFSGTPASIKETAHWFIDLSKFEKDISKWIAEADLREQTKAFLAGLLANGLVKRSMTRDIDWGVPLPIDDPDAKGKVLYVWFDAPIGYISNTMQLCQERLGNSERYTDWWKSKDTQIVHFIGEDNTIFHCVIWIAMLKAEGSYQLPKAVVVNQYLNMQLPGKEVEKISKSRGNAIWIEDYIAAGGDPDSLRYYLTMIAPEKARAVFKPDDMTQRHNSELANVLGNFVQRVLAFNHKYVGPNMPEIQADKVGDLEVAFEKAKQESFDKVSQFLDTYQFKAALEALMEYVRACNKYIDDRAPWATRKNDLPQTLTTLAYAINAIKFLSVTLQPFLPFSASKIAKMLNLDYASIRWQQALEPIKAGTVLAEPEILFKKIETPNVS